jgi:hypothetical protein
MNPRRLLQLVLLCFLFWTPPVEAKGRWQPPRLPTVDEVAKTIKHVLVNYDDGRCKTRAHRRKHPGRCVKVDGEWRQVKRGVWRWHNEKFRKEHYNDAKLRWYAEGIINALEKVGLHENFDYYVSMVMEALRQSKFHSRAWSRYNRGADGQYIEFTQPWCDGRKSLLSRMGKVCGPEGERRRCRNAIDLFKTGTEVAKKRFRRKCDWADRKGGDGGAYQMHMSTLARIAEMSGFKKAVNEILGHQEPWHYTMSQHFWVSALAGAYWQKRQGLVLIKPKTETGCGKWMQKRYSRRQLRHLGKTQPRSAIYSCFKLRYCNGTPMKVGNAKNACRRARFVRDAFRQVMDSNLEVTTADELM